MVYGKILLNSGLLSIAIIAFSTAIKNDFVISYYRPTIEPLHFDIKIRLYIKRNIFIGECTSMIRINHKISNISMHLGTFGIHKIYLIDKYQRIYKPNVYYGKHNANLYFDHSIKLIKRTFFLSPGIYTLKMTYIRIMFHQKKNFEKYSYLGANGNKIMAATGIEIMKVHQLFPWPTTVLTLLDKGVFNATFDIAIKHHQNYIVFSNMPVQTKYGVKNNMTWTEFDQLPSVFAKHLTIVITTFSNIATFLPNIKFWCRENMREHIQFAVTSVKNIVQYFIEKNLMKAPKIDYVAINDSEHNNDETWGLILQRNVDIIYDKKLDSAIRKIQIAHLIARQMTSFWHGNVILWSKESFATFVGAHVVDQIQQNDHIMNLIIVQIQQESLRFVTPSYVNPLLLITTNITEDNLFSFSLRNTKSFAMWRLLQHLLSNDMFWTGIRNYIDTNYLNVTDASLILDNLWITMQNLINLKNSEHKLNIKNIINIWTTKTYYPVLNVTRDYGNNVAEIVYVKSIDIIDNDIENWIPVSYTTQTSLNFTKTDNLFWLNSRNRSYNIKGINKNHWIIVNIQQIGYYRVNYDFENWKKLAHYLKYNNMKIHVLNRAQIIDDAYHFLLQKQLSYNMFWNLASFLARDTDYIAWYPMFKAFEHIMSIFSIEYGKDIRENMMRILYELIIKIGYYERSEDSDLTKCLRDEIIKWACVLGISECQIIANVELKKQLVKFKSETNLPRKDWIYCKGSMMADTESLLYLWYIWQTTLDTRILEFIACSKNSTFIYDYLKQIKEQEKHKTELKANKQAYIFLFIVAKHARNDMTLMLILENFYLLKPKLVNTIATLIVIITHIHSVNHLKEIEKFVKFNWPKQKELFQAVQRKIRKRKIEYAKLVGNYRLLIQS